MTSQLLLLDHLGAILNHSTKNILKFLSFYIPIFNYLKWKQILYRSFHIIIDAYYLKLIRAIVFSAKAAFERVVTIPLAIRSPSLFKSG